MNRSTYPDLISKHLPSGIDENTESCYTVEFVWAPSAPQSERADKGAQAAPIIGEIEKEIVKHAHLSNVVHQDRSSLHIEAGREGHSDCRKSYKIQFVEHASEVAVGCIQASKSAEARLTNGLASERLKLSVHGAYNELFERPIWVVLHEEARNEWRGKAAVYPASPKTRHVCSREKLTPRACVEMLLMERKLLEVGRAEYTSQPWSEWLQEGPWSPNRQFDKVLRRDVRRRYKVYILHSIR